MKKSFLQRAVAFILMAMLVIGSAFTVMAGENTDVPESTIDFTKTDSSITVTKYVSTETPDKGIATGTDDTSLVNPEYTVMEGATFILVRMKDEDFIKDYYDGTDATDITEDLDTAKLKVEKNANDNSITVTYVSDKATVTIPAYSESTDQSAPFYYVGTTEADGTYTFSNIPLGIYILKEIATPPQVSSTGMCEPTIISVPMVNTLEGENKTSTANIDWIYNIKVYPKNKANDSSVTITKKDNADNLRTISGVEFKLYKFDMVENAEKAIWSEVEKIDATTGKNLLVTDSYGELKITGLKAGVLGTQYKLVEVSAPNGYIANQTPLYFYIDSNRIIHWNNLTETEVGYVGCTNSNIFVGTSSVLGAPKVEDNTKLSFTLYNERPDLEKKVKVNGGDTWVKDEQYRLTDTITYRLIVKLPESLASMETFQIVDAPAAGIIDNITKNDVKVNVYTEESQKTPFDKFSITRRNNEDQSGFLFTITDGKSEIAGKKMEIVYTAKMNSSAVINGNGNLNTATLEYSIVTDDTDDTDDTYTIEDSAVVYTYDFQITKHKDTEGGDPISGVEFLLLDGDSSKTPIDVVAVKKNSEGKDLPGLYRLALSGETGVTMITDANGQIKIQGLENGTYYLKETKTIDGYNLLSEPFQIEVLVNEQTTWTPADGTGSFGEQSRVVKAYVSTQYLDKDGNVLKDENDVAITDPTGTADIINKKGFVLPQTGSMGYLLFSVIGILLVVGGSILLFGGRKKRIH